MLTQKMGSDRDHLHLGSGNDDHLSLKRAVHAFPRGLSGRDLFAGDQNA